MKYDIIKKYIPHGLWVKLQAAKSKHLLRKYFRRQYKAVATYFAIPGNDGERQLETQLLFYSHQIEKGLNHSNFRPGFGKRPLGMLSSILQLYSKKGYNPNSFEIKVTYSVLLAYKNKHSDNGLELPAYYSSIYKKYQHEIDRADPLFGGIETANNDSDYTKSYRNVLEHRTSIREFKDEPVDIAKVNEALSIAMSAPSVCNRQSQQVRVITNAALIHKALRIQGGWNGYKEPPALILITSHLSSFINTVERNEPYVDGGIFSMALLGALEEENLAACPLNAMFSDEQERGMRKVLSVPDEEVMVMFIALGNKPESILHPLSKRRDFSSVTKYLK